MHSCPKPAELESAWARYEEWNLALWASQLAGRHRFSPFYLDGSDEMLEAAAQELDSVPDQPGESFRSVVAQTLVAAEATVRGDLASHHQWSVQRAAQDESYFWLHNVALSQWAAGDRADAPPCVALLAFLSRVASLMVGDDKMRSTNYYGRLCEQADIPVESTREKKRLEANFRSDTPRYWDALAGWLESHDGELGVPTAEVFDRRRFIGLPLSQVLMRRADRSRLPDFFRHFGLRPGQTLAPEDLEDLFSRWMTTTTLSSRMRRLWRKQKQRQRVVEIVLTELESWGGEVPKQCRSRVVAHRTGPAALRLGLRRRTFPPPAKLQATLFVPGSVAAGQYTLEIGLGSSAGAPVDRFEAQVEDRPELNEVFVETAFALASLLDGPCLLRQERHELARRKLAPVVPLEYDGVQSAFVEVKNISLGTDTWLLVHRAFEDQIVEILESCARQGWSASTREGVPEHWRLFEGVQMMVVPRLAEGRQNDFSPLVPLSMTQIAAGGGFALGGRRWLSKKLPELRVVDAAQRRLRIELRTRGDGEEPRLLAEVPEGAGAWANRLSEFGLDDGDYQVLVTPQGAAGRPSRPSRLSIRLRSATRPRFPSKGSQGEQRLGLHLGRSGRLSAFSEEFEAPLAARGMAIEPGYLESEEASQARDLRRQLRDVEDDVDALYSHQGTSSSLDDQLPDCIVSGVHFWVFPPYDHREDKAKKMFVASCSGCGLTRTFLKNDFRQGPLEVERAEQLAKQAAAHTLPAETDCIPDANDLLDAVCWATSGDVSSLATLVEQLGHSPWATREVLRDLVALGHVDQSVSPASGKPLRWQVAPPAMVELGDGHAVLSGYRSDAVVQAIRLRVETLGGRLTMSTQEGGPDLISIDGVSPGQLHDIAALVSEFLGSGAITKRLYSEGLTVHRRVAQRLASAAPPASSWTAELQQVPLPAIDTLEEYCVADNSWQPATGLRPGTALVSRSKGHVYFFLTEDSLKDQRALVADYRVVKYLAAAAQAEPLLSYEEESRELQARLGARLPSLFERCAVACSGRLPVSRRGRHVYSDVPVEVAWMIMTKVGAIS